MRFHIVPLLMMLVPVPVADLARADDNASAVEQNEPRSAENPAPEADTGKRDRTTVRTLEEFVPSEEISADKPVSFPADI